MSKTYNFYAVDHKPNDGRISERVECDDLEDVRDYYERMKSLWKCEVNIYECDTNEQIFIED